MPEGGLLTITSSRKNNRIHIGITDTGVGIRKENHAKIFDACFTTKDSVKGVGLGLSVCDGFIKEHGGDIQVSSRADEGTSFTITLPVHKENA